MPLNINVHTVKLFITEVVNFDYTGIDFPILNILL